MLWAAGLLLGKNNPEMGLGRRYSSPVSTAMTKQRPAKITAHAGNRQAGAEVLDDVPGERVHLNQVHAEDGQRDGAECPDRLGDAGAVLFEQHAALEDAQGAADAAQRIEHHAVAVHVCHHPQVSAHASAIQPGSKHDPPGQGAEGAGLEEL